jgi:hypothetical protein
MPTPPFWCTSVALGMSRATCCIDTSENQSGHRSLRFHRVLLAESKAQTDRHKNPQMPPQLANGFAPARAVLCKDRRTGRSSRADAERSAQSFGAPFLKNSAAVSKTDQ